MLTQLTGHLCGLRFTESLPPRLLLTGRNGAGKTTRLRAIQYALRGFPNKDGLLPYMTPTQDRAHVGIQWVEDTGDDQQVLDIQRQTLVQRSPTLKVSNRTTLTPPLGETTELSAQARIDRTIRPRILSLDVDALFGLSGPARRRALLEALGSGAGTTIEWATNHLAAWRGRPTWDTIRSSLKPAPGQDVLEWLSAVEEAAKAAATQHRAEIASVQALVRTLPPEVNPGDADAARAGRQRVAAELEDLVRAKAQAESGRLLRQQIAARLQTAVNALPPTLKALWPDGDGLAEAARLVEETASAEETAEKAEETTATALEAAVAAVRDLHRQQDAIRGHGDALKALRDTPAGKCPLCATPGFDPGVIDAALNALRETFVTLTPQIKAAEEKVASAHAAQLAADKAADKASQARFDAAKFADLWTTAKSIAKDQAAAIETALAVCDEASLAAARERLQVAQDRLDACSAQEGGRRTRAEAEARAEVAKALLEDATALADFVGAKGLAGEILTTHLGPMADLMRQIFQDLTGRTLAWRLTDDRGRPTATLEATDPRTGATVALETLSQGERAMAIVALIEALARRADPQETCVALIEAGEVDAHHLGGMLALLGSQARLNTIVVASHGAPDRIPEPWIHRDLTV